jgi:hypothetical protein
MRWGISAACLLSLTLASCATPSPAFEPTGTDRAELTAAIASQGQDTSSDGYPPTQASSLVADCANVSVKFVEGAAYVAGMMLNTIAQAGGPR